MNIPFNFKNLDIDRLVYVRPVNVADLPEEVQFEALGSKKIYAVHAADGSRLALVGNRSLAFHLARQNDFAPVSVH